MDTPSLFSDDLSARQADFQQWVREVREPANAAREGMRRIVVRDALAEYEIAPLLEERWAVRYGLEYQSGDCHGHHAPWTAYPSRELCVAAFLDAARRHFGARLVGVAAGVTTQETARTAMLKQLRNGGLFGFIEPEVDRDAAQ
ncbi:MAG: hypothetical protein Q8K78_08625 [Planctomycetaceae bacterium]|nr:hypothetical protein [Planctomycetaceae bacterium]